MPEDSRTFEVEGYWWLPDQEDNKVAGILSYSPDSGASLRLIGTLSPPFSGGGNDGLYKRIHGLSGRKEFTLEDCFQKNYTGETETITVQQIFRGTWFTEEDEPNTDGVAVEMRYLTQWVGHRGITSKHYTQEEISAGSPYASLEVRLQPARTVTLSNGLSVKLGHTIGLPSHTGTEQSLREHYAWRINFSNLVSTYDAIEYVSDLQDLVSIATGRVAEYEQVTFSHPDAVLRSGQTDHRIPISYFTEWIARDTSRKPGVRHPSEMLFTFDDLGGIGGVQSWMESMASYRTALGRVMASRYRDGLFVEDRLFHRAAALEAFGRTRIGNKNVKLKGALEHCCNLAGGIFEDLVGDTNSWVSIVVSNRNDIGHHLGKRPNQSGSAQYFLAESLYWLFVVCALRETSAPAAVFERIKKHAEWVWLGPKVQAVVQTG